MEPKSSLPHSQQPAACPYLEPDQVASFQPVSPTKTPFAPLLSPYMLHSLAISVFLIWSPE